MSTFSSLNTALSGLRYNRVAAEVAVNAAVQEDREHGNQAYLVVRRRVLEQVRVAPGDPGPEGLAAAFESFRNAWAALAEDPCNGAVRARALVRSVVLSDVVRARAAGIDAEAGRQRLRVLAALDEAGGVAVDLAATNERIAAATVDGSDAGALLDRRARLAVQLSELAGAHGAARADGGFDVDVNGVPLVVGPSAGVLSLASGIRADGSSDGNPITFAITDGTGSSAVPSGMTGEVGGVTDLLSTTLPAYGSGLDAVAQQLADEVNAQHVLGLDAAGRPGRRLFSYDAANPAGTLAVAVEDATALAADADVAGPAGYLSSYRCLENGFGAEVARVERLAADGSDRDDWDDDVPWQLATYRVALAGTDRVLPPTLREFLR